MKIIAKISDYLLLIGSLITLSGAIIYYFYALNWLGIIISLVIAGGGFIVVRKLYLQKISWSAIKIYPRPNKHTFLLVGINLLFFITSLVFLIKSQSDRALISPWEVVGKRFFLFYLLASVSLIVAVISKRIAPIWKITLISLHYFLSLGVATLIYKIGYGFDPFIHQATMELISKTGAVEPKPFYYLGEYSLLVIIHKISGLSIYFLNKFFVPLLAALLLPTIFYRFLISQSRHGATANKFLTIIFLTGLTFTPFIATTPQNFSYLLLITTILLGLSRAPLGFILLLSLTTSAIHPLSGLPTLFFTAWLYLKKYQPLIKPFFKKILITAIFIGNATAIPLALLLVSQQNLSKITFSWSKLFTSLKNILPGGTTAGREDWLLNILYFFANNLNLFIILITGASLIYFYHRQSSFSSDKKNIFSGIILINGSLLLAYFLSGQIFFNDLINYEQANYANRLLLIMIFFFLPFIILALNQLIKKILLRPRMDRLIWLGAGLTILGASLYISYPRFDRYYNSHGFSTSRADCQAVQLIAQEATGPYIALANQQVSAAALKEQGFDHYYQSAQGLIYFYPIPTGGPLYQYYLKMAYKKPSRESMGAALDLAGVNEGYLIINKYWYQSDRIINAAKLSADSWQTLDNGNIYIFKYQR